jgi:hypothetical protein
VWGDQLLERGPGAGSWLLSLGRTQKFGFTPIFLNYLRFWDKPEYAPAVRTMYALLGLLDLIPIDQQFWFAQVKQDFDMGAADVRFQGYWEQTAVRTDRADVKASLYTRQHSALILVANLSKEPFAGKVEVDLERLGLASTKVLIRNPEEKDAPPLPLQDGAVTLQVPPHDFRMLWVAEQP